MKRKRLIGRPPSKHQPVRVMGLDSVDDRNGGMRYDLIARILTERGHPTTAKSARTLHSRAIKKIREALYS